MQAARGDRVKGGAIAEVAFDALAADLTVPHSRPLVDLDRDDYADLEVADPPTVPYERVAPFDPPVPHASFDPVVDPPVIPPRIERAPTERLRRRTWRATHVVAAVVTTAIGFGLGAGVASLLV